MQQEQREMLDYFGACPECGRNDGFLNIGRNHIAMCETHKTAWCFGSNLLSSWRSEDEATWRTNADKLATYREVEPIHFKDEIPRPSYVRRVK